MPSACTQAHCALPTPEWEDIQQSKGQPRLWEGWISLKKVPVLPRTATPVSGHTK